MCRRAPRRAARSVVGARAVAQLRPRRRPPGPSARSAGPRPRRRTTAGWASSAVLDLLGEDLLAAGVDRDRVAAEQLDRAVGEVARAVAGHRVAHAVDRPGTCAPSCPRRRGSRAARARAGPASRSRRRPARARASRSSETTQVPGPGLNVPVDAPAGCRHVLSLRARLRRADAVDEISAGHALEQPLLDASALSGAPPRPSGQRSTGRSRPRLDARRASGRANASPTIEQDVDLLALDRAPGRRRRRGCSAIVREHHRVPPVQAS